MIVLVLDTFCQSSSSSQLAQLCAKLLSALVRYLRVYQLILRFAGPLCGSAPVRDLHKFLKGHWTRFGDSRSFLLFNLDQVVVHCI